MKHNGFTTLRAESGFSLIELLVYLAILGILMTLVFMSFTDTLQRSIQQSGIAESKIESAVGLDLLRMDLEHAGFGLPWQFQSPPNPYTEPVGNIVFPAPVLLPLSLAPLADAPSGNIPRALISAENASFNNSDYLVIRATNVTRGASGQKFGYVGRDAAHNIDIQNISTDQFINTDGVIVLRPETTPGQYRQLMTFAGNYLTAPTVAGLANYAPVASPNDPNGEKYLLYGLDDSTLIANINRPFNRTDYYINNTAVPTHCAPNTGVLVKAQLNQADNNFTINPIVDCVADFQIVYYIDTNDDGGWDQRSNADGLNGLDALQIRNRVKAIRYFILTHEGGLDPTYTRPAPNIAVGEVAAADGVTLVPNAGRVFALNAIIGGAWANYRWKVESMAINLKNLK